MSTPRVARRVAVTGLGVVSPIGIGCDAFWNGLLSPQPSGERRIHDFDASLYFESSKEVRRADRFTQFTVAAASEALEQAGELAADPQRTAMIIGTGVGGLMSFESQVLVHAQTPRRVSPFLVPSMMANAAAAALSIRYGFQGPCESISTACATGTHSIGYAARLIQWGLCDAVITGSSEAAITPVVCQAFGNMRALSADGRSRPFDVDRNGFVISEGGAILVLEEWEAAVARRAPILAEVLGSSSSSDASHITQPAEDGSGAIRCMELAIEDAQLAPSDIRHINAHGTGTPLNDAAEARAIEKVFGLPGPAVCSIKGVTGHSLGAAGALEAAAVVLSFQKRLIPPTDGNETFDPELPAIDLVKGAPREWELGPTLSNSFGFGGHNGSLVLGPADPS
jgi:3-oxoacyl-[acyl-carrier-protein] synthase II